MYRPENSPIANENIDPHPVGENVKKLLYEHDTGISIAELEDLYKASYGSSLFSTLLKQRLSGNYEEFIFIQQPDGNEIINLKENIENDQEQYRTIFSEISASGIVPRDFHYAAHPFATVQNGMFAADVSQIDRQNHVIYMQPEATIENIESLTEELDLYYSNSVSDNLLVKDIMINLACVAKYDGIYHRSFIKENHIKKCAVTYVDIGLTEEVDIATNKFKHLLNYFAKLPCLAIPCRLRNIEFKLDENFRMSADVYQQLRNLFRTGPFSVKIYDLYYGKLNVNIFDSEQQCMNEIIVKQGLAFSSSTEIIAIDGDYKDESYENNLLFRNAKKSPDHTANNLLLKSESNMINNTITYSDYEEDTLAESVANGSESRNMTNSTHTPQHDSAKLYENKSMNKICGTNQTFYSMTPQHERGIRNHNATKPTDRPYELNIANKEPRKLQITVDFDKDESGIRRIFNSAMSSLINNYCRNAKQRFCVNKHVISKSKDDFAAWICSTSDGQSLWMSREHENALLSYIGKIYGRKPEMYRIYTHLKKIPIKLDELDLLNQLILKCGEQSSVNASIHKWEDDSRIERRIKDLEIIFEYNGDCNMRNNPFQVMPQDIKQIINKNDIKSYFDLGCGNGTITAAIGDYLGLTRENIFGGDVFEVQNENISFIKIDERESKIDLLDNVVDLVTAFVTFHHVAQVEKTLREVARILRSNGYLIIREHDCKNERSVSAKYLHFVHAVMMIAQVGEFANSSNNLASSDQQILNSDYQNDTDSWEQRKPSIISYLRSIHYRSGDEWRKEFEKVGFEQRATLYYGVGGGSNPQKLFYAVYQLIKQ